MLNIRCSVVTACLALAVGSVVYSQESATKKPSRSEDAKVRTADPTSEPSITFAFEGTPWKNVIQTVAETGDMAVHIGDLPVGSFTYSDSKKYSVQEAISRVNLFLLPEGYTLVRSGRLLSVINLSDPRSLKQLDSLAKLVPVDSLDKLPDHDVVKCIFPLGDLQAEDAVEELAGLNLMMTPSEFSRTNRILVIDTAAKLRTVHELLKSFAPDQLNNGTVVKSFELKHADAEDVLIVARPHLGLATGEMIGIDVSLSADPEGKNLFVTGVDDKVKLVENLVKSLDQPGMDLSTENGELSLKSHPVSGGNLNSVYNVLLTLLADKEVRLSMDAEAESIVALADSEVHARIEGTIKQLQASEKEFAVIQLKTVDPYLAISLIEQMLDLGDSGRLQRAGIEAFTRHGNTRGFDLINQVQNDDGPKIDADPINRRLFVRAKKSMMTQIKKIVEQIDNASGVDDNDTIRMLPIKGKQAIKLLETAARFWRGNNPVLLYPSSVETDSQPQERIVADKSGMTFDELFGTSTPIGVPASAPAPAEVGVRILTRSIGGTGAAIRCQVVPNGLLLQCEDVKALAAFERHFRAISGPVDLLAAPPVVFYLKYTKPDDALRMLAELLDGGEAAKDGETGELVNGAISSGYDTYLGSIVASREGTTTMMNGSITVVADNRLNRLIAQGTSTDIELIEGYLKIVDKDGSITAIETYGQTRVIELKNTKASEVAEVLKEAYARRMAKNPNKSGAAGQGGREGDRREDRGGDRNRRAPAQKAERDLEPKMTIAVHEPSNSLIVTAPTQLFAEVEKLAQLVDRRSEQTVKILNMENLPDAQLIQQIFGDRVRTGQPVSRSRSRSSRSSRSRSR